MYTHFIRFLLALFGLIACGVAQASIAAFEDYAAASDGELDSMRGGFEVNFNGMQLLLAFSLEQLTYINGELVSSMKLNPIALISNPATGAAAVVAAAPSAGSSTANAGAQGAAPAAVASSPGGQAAAVSTQVINNQGVLTLVQNGAGNAIALPEALNSLTTVIQNSVNDQVIRNITVMNATLAIQMDAAMARLNEAISQATAASVR
jgi:hypothetical protein